MKKQLLATAALIAGLAGTASAELSYGVDAALGYWTNGNGGMGLDSSGGISGTDQRMAGRVNLSIANDFGGFVGQVDLFFQTLDRADPALDDDDATSSMGDLTLRGMRDFNGTRAGLFLGYGEQDDYGDSNENMTYEFLGLDASRDTGFGQVYGQLGYLDSHDEYDEGIHNAWFLRVGAETSIAPDMTVFGAVSAANGLLWDDYDAQVLGLEVGVEKALGNGMSLYGSIDWTRQYYKDSGNNFGDNFTTAWVGVKWNLDGKESRAKKLPQIGTWVSYFANEIE